MSLAGVADQVGERAQRNRDGTGADSEMGGFDADDVNEQRHRENRTAAADQPETEPDQHTGKDGKNVGEAEVHERFPLSVRDRRPARP